MQNTKSNIIKAEQIEMQEPQPLDTSKIQTKQNPENNQTSDNQPTASLIEKNENFAKIRITCSCGKNFILKCDYENQNDEQQKNES